MIFDYHVLFKQQVNGVRIRGVWAVVEAKLCDEKEDDCDHQLRRRIKMTLTGSHEVRLAYIPKDGGQGCEELVVDKRNH